jgi:multidrug efflux pump subunit AcrA (membrane-fusion protein)
MQETNNIDLSKLRISREEQAPSNKQKQPRSKLLIYIAGFVIVLLVIFYIYKTSLSPVEVVEVATVSLVSPSQANALLTASGYVVAQRKAAIASKATGRLVYLGYEEGDKVKKGEIIARIESADVNAALAQAKANLELNQAQKIDAERSLERAKKLFAGKLISQAEFDATQMRYDQVVAGIAVSKAG